MWRLSLLCLLASAAAQIPSLGWCPDFQPMVSFNMNRFLGTWYEVERYFTVSELGSRCVATNYISTPEGRILVSNEITNYITGLKRLMEGHLQMVGREGEGRFMVKYSSLPLPYDYEYSILDTDYDSFAVMWSCSGLGPVHTQSAWLLTRERLPSLATMQRAYAVLDRFKISRAFFVKTNQADCTVLPDPIADPEYEGGKSVDKEMEKGVGADLAIPAVEYGVEKIDLPVVKKADPEVKAEVLQDRANVVEPKQPIPAVVPVVVPQERSAIAEPNPKPVPVPELIMSETKIAEEKVEEPKLKIEIPEIPAEPEKKVEGDNTAQ